MDWGSVLYQMARGTPYPGTTSMNAISAQMEKLKKDKQWREKYELEKQRIMAEIQYKDLAAKLMGEKAETEKGELEAFRGITGGAPTTMPETTEPFRRAGAGLSMMPGMAMPGAMLQGLPPTTQRPTYQGDISKYIRDEIQKRGGVSPGLMDALAKFGGGYPERPTEIPAERGGLPLSKIAPTGPTYERPQAKEITDWEIKVDRYVKLYNDKHISKDNLLKGIGAYIPPENKSDFDKKIDLLISQKVKVSPDEIKKLAGAYIEPKEEELSLEEKERIKASVKSDRGVINLFEGSEERGEWIEGKLEQSESRGFTNEEKESLGYSLKRYNATRRKQDLSEFEFMKAPKEARYLKGGKWVRDYYGWILQEKTTGTGTPTGNIKEEYNKLRSQGVSEEEAKRRLGIK